MFTSEGALGSLLIYAEAEASEIIPSASQCSKFYFKLTSYLAAGDMCRRLSELFGIEQLRKREIKTKKY